MLSTKFLSVQACKLAIVSLFSSDKKVFEDTDYTLFQLFKDGLNAGLFRAAEPTGLNPTGWQVNEWVKQGILLGFRMGVVRKISGSFGQYYDKDTYPLKDFGVDPGLRVVPGGSSVRDGCYVGKGVVCMPPMYINVGAYVDEGTMVDSNALVGSCAQIGKKCHISAGTQIGGVLEPVGAMPVILEDEVMVGGNCGVYEGTIVKKGAVIGAGTILTASTPVYDCVEDVWYRKTEGHPLIIPSGAVVVPGARRIASGPGRSWEISTYTPIIVKYRDSKTDTVTTLEESLRL